MQQHDLATLKATAGTLTAGTGIATWLSWIEGALGIIATLLGICLTSWLIYKEIRQERARRAAIAAGDHVRRKGDM